MKRPQNQGYTTSPNPSRSAAPLPVVLEHCANILPVGRYFARAGALKFLLVTVIVAAALSGTTLSPKEIQPPTATVEVHAGQQGCVVDLDSGAPSKTGANGSLTIAGVGPGDHYLHIECPGHPALAILISPSAGATYQWDAKSAPANSGPTLEPAEVKQQLLQHIQESIQLRARGHIEEAAQHLRDARLLDPANSDLHRELGVTFLIGKEWKQARIEMLEAIRYEANDADAYNGLAYALEKLGNLDAAAEAYHTAMKLDPTDSSYRRHYFDALSKQVAKRAERMK